ncbi:MAG: T9SS type A sorting domain-containing protein, partial [Candidatus Krumholzibacteria bacterium]|nr:T9SS type A sorting domain-containing protein [Candidatus Krumholzibacteria bacterium]
EDTIHVDPSAPSGSLYYIVTATDVHENQSAPSNEASVSGATGAGNTPALTALTVRQNRPNPFTASTELEIGLPAASAITIEVYDVAGRRVRALEVQGAGAGWQRVPFAGVDESGAPLASGVYFYRVTANGATVTRKMVIAR